jgi:hypothetical protein
MVHVGFQQRGDAWGNQHQARSTDTRDQRGAASYGEGPYPAQRGMDQDFSLDRRAYGNPVRNRVRDESAGSPGAIRGALDRLLAGATKQDRALRRSLLFCVVVIAFSLFIRV